MEGVVQEVVVEGLDHTDHTDHTQGEATIERLFATDEWVAELPPSVVPHADGGDVLDARVVTAADGSRTVVSATVTRFDVPAVEGSVRGLAAGGVREVFVALVVPAGTPQSANRNTVESVSALLSEADAFWADQTGGAVRFAVAASLPLYTSAHHCSDLRAMANEARDRFVAAGHTARGPQTHLLLALPNRSDGVAPDGCPSGLATIGPSYNNHLFVGDDRGGLYAHELGHNLGLAHSDALRCDDAQDATPVDVTLSLVWPAGCRDIPYGDALDVMGEGGRNAAQGSLNVAHMSHLGFTPSALHDVTTVGVTSVTIAPLSDTNSLRGLRIADAGGRGYYYVEYRTASGRDALPTLAYQPAQLGVRILRDNPVFQTGSYVLDSTPTDRRIHWDALPPGQTFTSADGSVAVKLVEANDDGATLHVARSVPMGSPTSCVVALPSGLIASRPCSGAPTTPTPLPMLEPETTNSLGPGQRLTAGQQLVSPSGTYRAVMQTDGNFVVYAGSRAVWYTLTNGHPRARLVMQGDGNLVMYSADNRPLWHTRTNGQGSARLLLQDDGSLVLHRSDDRPMWRVGNSTLARGQRMSAGQQLTSRDGRYRFVMQADGNAVVYTGSRAVWSVGTQWYRESRLLLQDDGNLVLYSSDGRPLWQSRTDAGARLVMQDDGNLVLYSAADRAVWNSGRDRSR